MHNFRQLYAEDADLKQALAVMRAAFSGMSGRIDPPTSLDAMQLDDLARTARDGEVWVTGQPVAGTVVLTARPGVLYIGKLAVLDQRRGMGRAFIQLAQERAAALGLGWLELQSRVELIEVHAAFKALGFREVMRTTHAGYQRPTSITFRKMVG